MRKDCCTEGAYAGFSGSITTAVPYATIFVYDCLPTAAVTNAAMKPSISPASTASGSVDS